MRLVPVVLAFLLSTLPGYAQSSNTASEVERLIERNTRDTVDQIKELDRKIDGLKAELSVLVKTKPPLVVPNSNATDANEACKTYGYNQGLLTPAQITPPASNRVSILSTLVCLN